MKHHLLILSFLLISCTLFSQKHWESIILASDTWSYLPALSEPPATWFQSTFDDSAWKTGAGGIGYADGDDATTIAAVNSVYIRKKFTIANVDLIDQLLLDIDYDDAFVLYLNGKEVARSSNITATPPLYNSAITIDHEALLYRSLLPERYILSNSSLIKGVNLIAVQILNYNLASTDLSSLVFLNARINSVATVYRPVPSWFVAPTSTEDTFESNLPLISINTQGLTILDEPKITARMNIINNESGINNIKDTTYNYNGLIGIEMRGSSSLTFEKKSFGFETRTDSATNLNVSLLGLPKENDWVLYGPYPDKTLIRNVLAYKIGNLFGRWSPHTRFCEVFINKEYRGLYVLIEKIKIDKSRLNLSKLKVTDITGDNLSGGYLLKIDRPDPGYWISPYKARNDIQNVSISYVDPVYEDLMPEQRTYIKDYITNFENVVRSANYKDPVAGYRPLVNYTSFVDYYILNELSRNLDGYRLSTFFHKDKDSKGGKLTMGPFWDYDLTFGNANFFSAGNTSGWVVDGLGNGDEYGIPFWWDKFRLDPYFNSQLKLRWNELRADKLSNVNLTAIIDSCATDLTSAQVRNFQKYNILSTYVWPNNYIGGSYANELDYMKTWITNRLVWMES
ncbi:MAG: CotH kinase family protein, partial [Paludibacter sp.]